MGLRLKVDETIEVRVGVAKVQVTPILHLVQAGDGAVSALPGVRDVGAPKAREGVKEGRCVNVGVSGDRDSFNVDDTVAALGSDRGFLVPTLAYARDWRS